MTVSAAVKALIASANIKQGDLRKPLGVGSVQAVSNKFRLNRWSASDLVAVADFAGAKLAFLLPDGDRILISDDAGPGSGAAPAQGTGGGKAPGSVSG